MQDAECDTYYTWCYMASHTVPDEDACSVLHQRLFQPCVLKLALLSTLQKDSQNVNSMHNLDTFANRLTFEKKHIILNETGLSLSRSMFIPFKIMHRGLLDDISELLRISVNRCTFNNVEKQTSVVFTLVHEEMLGVPDVICAFFLIMNDASENSKQRPDKSRMPDSMLSVFDVLLKSICFKQRVDYQTIIQKCTEYGYGNAPHSL